MNHYRTCDHVAGCKQQVKIDGRIDGKDEILDALSKIIKFMNYEFENLIGFYERPPIRKDIIFFFPIVVFSGDLYFASFENELEINEIPHALYETRYLSSLTGTLVPLYVDIVRKEAFPELVSLIEKEVIQLNQYMSKPETQESLNDTSAKLFSPR